MKAWTTKKKKESDSEELQKDEQEGAFNRQRTFLLSLHGICVGSEQGQSQHLQYAIYGQDVGVAINTQRTTNRFYFRLYVLNTVINRSVPFNQSRFTISKLL